MLPWWAWLLIWVGLLAGSALLLWVRVRALWRAVKATAAEVARAERTLDALGEAASALPDDPDAGFVPSVLRNRAEVARESARVRSEVSAARRARRAARMPPWAST